MLGAGLRCTPCATLWHLGPGQLPGCLCAGLAGGGSYPSSSLCFPVLMPVLYPFCLSITVFLSVLICSLDSLFCVLSWYRFLVLQ